MRYLVLYLWSVDYVRGKHAMSCAAFSVPKVSWVTFCWSSLGKDIQQTSKGSIWFHRNIKRERSSPEMKHWKIWKWNTLTSCMFVVWVMTMSILYIMNFIFSNSRRWVANSANFHQYQQTRKSLYLGSSSKRNLVTCSEVDLKLSAFLSKADEVGETAYNELRTSRILGKSAKLFQRYTPHKKYDLVKEKLTLPEKKTSSWKKLIMLA